MTTGDFPTDGSFEPTAAQTAQADQRFAAVDRALDTLVTEARHSIECGESGLRLTVSVGLRVADEVAELGGDLAAAVMALAAAAVVRLAAIEPMSAAEEHTP